MKIWKKDCIRSPLKSALYIVCELLSRAYLDSSISSSTTASGNDELCTTTFKSIIMFIYRNHRTCHNCLDTQVKIYIAIAIAKVKCSNALHVVIYRRKREWRKPYLQFLWSYIFGLADFCYSGHAFGKCAGKSAGIVDAFSKSPYSLRRRFCTVT